MKHQTIGKLASATGVGIETIRFYEREGLLDEPRRTQANYRLYPPAAEQQLRFIAHAKTLGFSLAEIRELVHLQKGGRRADVRDIASRHLSEVRQKLRALNSIESVLSALVRDCDGQGESSDGCPILEALTEASKVPSNEPKKESTHA